MSAWVSAWADAENVRYLLDSKGKVLQTYDTGTDNYMEDGGERPS